MRKARLGIEETLKYQRSMIVEIPDEITDTEFDRILDRVQAKADAAGDIPYLLKKEIKGGKVVEFPDENMSSPWDTEVEIDDLDFLD